MKTNKSQKVLIVDDHPLTREGIRTILENEKNIQIVGEANDGLDGVSQVIEKKPDIVIMDITMPHMSGIDATKEILSEYPETKIVALSIHSGERFVKEMLAAGAVGYLLKESAPEELVLAIKKVMNGDIYLSSRITRTALSKNTNEETANVARILRTKLLRPPVASEYIVREKIIDELEQNIVKPLTLVSAGAGYGKSVTISQWLAHSQRLHVWISLDEEHNDLRTFLQYLHEAIVLVIPGSLTETGKAINVIELPPLNQLIHILLNDLFDIEDELIFVLDDFHKIKNEEIHQLFDEWLSFPPSNINLCIITRRDPPLKINLLQLQGRITEIRMNKLSFVYDEIVNLFKQQLGVELDDDSIHTLHEKTEGWIIGLRLATMLIKNQEDVYKVLKTFEGGLETLSDYLISEVLAHFPPALKNQLLITSVLNRFCDELIDEIFEVLGPDSKYLEATSSGRKFIMWLIESNMFVINLDSQNKWFRYHHLFQALIFDQLKSQLGNKMIEQIHYKASEWFEDHNFLEEAMYHAIEIQDFERASKIITEHRLELLNVDQWYVMEKLFSHLPESVVDSSIDLILVKAHIVFYHTDLVGLSEQVAKIEKLMEKIENPKELPYYGEFVFYQAHMYLFFQQDIAKTYELLSLAMEMVPESQAELRGRTELLFSLTAQMHGKYEEVYQKALLRDRSVRVNPVLRSRRFLNLMWLPMVAADPAKASEYNIKLVNKSRNDGQLVGIAWALYTSALIYLFKGLWQKAIVQLEELMGMNYMWYTISEMDAMAALIIAYQLNGETEKAQKILKTLDRYATDMAPFYQSWLWAAKARYFRLTDDLEAIKQITVRQEVVSIGNPVYYYHVPVNVECQALIFEGSEASLLLAEEKLNGLITLCEDQNNILHWIELLIYKSILEYKKGMIEESVVTLMKAINLAEPGKLMVFFIEMGIPVLKIVDEMSKEQREHPYLLEVVERIALTPFYNDKKVVKKKVIKEQLNILTASELKVLECVADGLRNQEIAEKLFNSEETIKKHVYNMFQKLNVKNRLSLVAKAKEEGILA